MPIIKGSLYYIGITQVRLVGLTTNNGAPALAHIVKTGQHGADCHVHTVRAERLQIIPDTSMGAALVTAKRS